MGVAEDGGAIRVGAAVRRASLPLSLRCVRGGPLGDAPQCGFRARLFMGFALCVRRRGPGHGLPAVRKPLCLRGAVVSGGRGFYLAPSWWSVPCHGSGFCVFSFSRGQAAPVRARTGEDAARKNISPPPNVAGRQPQIGCTSVHTLDSQWHARYVVARNVRPGSPSQARHLQQTPGRPQSGPPPPCGESRLPCPRPSPPHCHRP